MKRLSIEELRFPDLVRPGDCVLWGQVCGEAQTLTEALVAQRAAIGKFRVFIASGFSQTLQPEHSDCIRMTGLGAIGTPRALVAAGVLDVIPAHISQVEKLIEGGQIPCDVLLVQVSRPNERGQYSLGLISDYLRTAARKARVVIAEVNAQVPWTPCQDPLTEADIDFFIETDRALLEVDLGESTAIDKRIAAIADGYIPDRAVLQLGAGGVPEAIMSLLHGRKGLGIHSGMIGDSVADLMMAGVVTNEYKEIDPGVTVTGSLRGTQKLYRYCDGNAAIRMAPISYTHQLSVIARLSKFISINSALEVDLTGQVNAEAVGGSYLGAVGGQVDYVRAAGISAGGRSIIALPASAHRGETSRIVTALKGPVTTPRSDVDLIITENGAAELRGKTLRERARAMIAIADARFQEDLERQAFNLFKN